MSTTNQSTNACDLCRKQNEPLESVLWMGLSQLEKRLCPECLQLAVELRRVDKPTRTSTKKLSTFNIYGPIKNMATIKNAIQTLAKIKDELVDNKGFIFIVEVYEKDIVQLKETFKDCISEPSYISPLCTEHF
jgi:hypothetical protein